MEYQTTATQCISNSLSLQIRVTDGNSDELEYKYSDEMYWTTTPIIDELDDEGQYRFAFRTVDGIVYYIDEFIRDNI